MTPLAINVKASLNSDVITPLQLGSITYEYPNLTSGPGGKLTTDKISEIVVTDSPIGYNRYQALFEDLIPSIGISTSDYERDPISYAALRTLNYSANVPLAYGGTGATKLGVGGKFTDWASPASKVNSPQLDFFPRYNQWFASVSWAVPPLSLTRIPKLPEFYPILLVYVDRPAKKVYYRQGKAFFNSTMQSQDNIEIQNVSEKSSNSTTRTYSVDWVTYRTTVSTYKLYVRINKAGAPAGDGDQYTGISVNTAIGVVSTSLPIAVTVLDNAATVEVVIVGEQDGAEFARSEYFRIK